MCTVVILLRRVLHKFRMIGLPGLVILFLITMAPAVRGDSNDGEVSAELELSDDTVDALRDLIAEMMDDLEDDDEDDLYEPKKIPPPVTVLSFWSQWSDWSRCDVTCEAGTARRFRQCFPQKSSCIGPNSETRKCMNIINCPRTPPVQSFLPIRTVIPVVPERPVTQAEPEDGQIVLAAVKSPSQKHFIQEEDFDNYHYAEFWCPPSSRKNNSIDFWLTPTGDKLYSSNASEAGFKPSGSCLHLMTPELPYHPYMRCKVRASEDTPPVLDTFMLIPSCREFNPCLHGSKCHNRTEWFLEDNRNNFTCHCINGFAGTFCELPGSDSTHLLLMAGIGLLAILLLVVTLLIGMLTRDRLRNGGGPPFQPSDNQPPDDDVPGRVGEMKLQVGSGLLHDRDSPASEYVLMGVESSPEHGHDPDYDVYEIDPKANKSKHGLSKVEILEPSKMHRSKSTAKSRNLQAYHVRVPEGNTAFLDRLQSKKKETNTQESRRQRGLGDVGVESDQEEIPTRRHPRQKRRPVMYKLLKAVRPTLKRRQSSRRQRFGSLQFLEQESKTYLQKRLSTPTVAAHKSSSHESTRPGLLTPNDGKLLLPSSSGSAAETQSQKFFVVGQVQQQSVHPSSRGIIPLGMGEGPQGNHAIEYKSNSNPANQAQYQYAQKQAKIPYEQQQKQSQEGNSRACPDTYKVIENTTHNLEDTIYVLKRPNVDLQHPAEIQLVPIDNRHIRRKEQHPPRRPHSRSPRRAYSKSPTRSVRFGAFASASESDLEKIKYSQDTDNLLSPPAHSDVILQTTHKKKSRRSRRPRLEDVLPQIRLRPNNCVISDTSSSIESLNNNALRTPNIDFELLASPWLAKSKYYVGAKQLKQTNEHQTSMNMPSSGHQELRQVLPYSDQLLNENRSSVHGQSFNQHLVSNESFDYDRHGFCNGQFQFPKRFGITHPQTNVDARGLPPSNHQPLVYASDQPAHMPVTGNINFDQGQYNPGLRYEASNNCADVDSLMPTTQTAEPVYIRRQKYAQQAVKFTLPQILSEPEVADSEVSERSHRLTKGDIRNASANNNQQIPAASLSQVSNNSHTLVMDHPKKPFGCNQINYTHLRCNSSAISVHHSGSWYRDTPMSYLRDYATLNDSEDIKQCVVSQSTSSCNLRQGTKSPWERNSNKNNSASKSESDLHAKPNIQKMTTNQALNKRSGTDSEDIDELFSEVEREICQLLKDSNSKVGKVSHS